MTKLSLNRLGLCVVASALLAGAAGCSKESKANRYTARAAKDFAAERYDRAEIEYIAALRLVPANAEAAAGLGSVYFNQGRLPQAFGPLTRALELEPSNTDVELKLGIICRTIGQLPQARAHALNVVKQQPANPEALLLLIDSSTTNELEECSSIVDSIPAGEQNSLGAHLARGSIRYRQKDFPGAESEFNQAIAINPKSHLPYYPLYSVYLDQNKTNQADEAIRTAAELAPIRSFERVRYARYLLHGGRADEAKKTAAEITQKAADYMPAWEFLAETAFKERKQDECAALVEKILAKDSFNKIGRSLNGKLMLASGDVTNALKQFEWIVQQLNTNSESYYNLARAQVQNGQEHLAIANLNRAILTSSNNIDAVILQSTLLMQQGNFRQAASSLHAIISREETLGPEELTRLPNAFALLARAQSGLGNTSDAVATYEAMPKIFPGLLEVHLEAAVGLAGLSRTNEAKQAFIQYATASTNTLGLLLAGRGLAGLGDGPAARQTFEKALMLDPNYTAALLALIQTDIREGKYPEAMARARQEIDVKRGGGVPWAILARIHMERAFASARKTLGDKAGEAQLFKLPAVQEDLKSAEAALLKATEIDPGLTEAYHSLARLYVASGRKDEALAKLNSLLAKTNDLTSSIQVALIHSHAAEYKAAADVYERALRFAPESAVALNNLAAIYSAQVPNLDRAQELAQRAIAIAPNSPAVKDTLGWILHKKGDYSQALGLLKDAVKALPEEAEAGFHLGMTYYMLGQEQPAKAALERVAASTEDFAGKDQVPPCLAVLAIDPVKADATAIASLEKRVGQFPADVVAQARLAAVLERDGAFDRAAEKYQELLKWSPKNTQAAYKLARIYADRLNQVDKALETAKIARSNDPEDPEVAHLLGRLAFEKRNWSWAANLLEESARKLPDSPEVAFDLARANYVLGRVSEAEAKMKVVLASPGFSKAEEAKQFLKFIAAQNDPSPERFSQDLENALKADSDYLPGLVLSGAIDERKGNFERAAGTYDHILSVYPSFTPATRSLALVCFEHLKQDQRAYELALKARQAYPADPLIAKVLGIHAFGRNENARAVQMLSEASQKRNDDAEVFYYLGMAQKALKSKTESKAALERALSLKLPEALAAQAKQALTEESKP